MKKNIVMLMIVLVSAISAKAQDITSTTMRWNSNRFFDGTAGVWHEDATYVVIQSKTKIQWFNANGSLRKSIQVAEVIGEWADATTPGLLQYKGTDLQGSCSITVQKNAQETKVLLVFGLSNPQVYELLVTGNQVL